MAVAVNGMLDCRDPLAAAARSTSQPAGDVTGRAEHFVQFYRDEQVLIGSASDYVRQALHGGAAAIVIATAPHIEALQDRWRSSLPEASAARIGDRLTLLEAGEALARFMVGGAPDRERFFATVGDIVSEALRRHGRVAVFGEMVAPLWKESTAAAVQLEQLWNELAQRRSFTLFCAYPMQECADYRHIVPFEAVCTAHTRVIPMHSSVFSAPDQGRLVAQLQHKALALEKMLAQEAARQEGLAHLAAIVASSDDAIVSKTLDGTIKSWNAGAERIFGWSAQEAVGRSITFIIPPERLDEERRILETLERGERIDHFETGLPRTGVVSISHSPYRRCAMPRGRSSAPRRSPVTSPSANAARPGAPVK